MKLNETWLREWVNPAITTDVLCTQLSLAGLEVDSVEPVANEFNHVLVGEIIHCEDHPDAKKLRVCRVDVGENAPLQIVCGAKNAREGIKVAVAIEGAVLGNDFKIKATKLRGVESCGMLCSESELGLADSSDGIMELPLDAPIGDDLRAYLKLDDVSIDVELTANRGDCLSVQGVARELAVINELSMTVAKEVTVEPKIEDAIKVKISAEKACPRYLGRIIKNANLHAKSPLWLTERLRRCGLRSIAPAVDVTNYVMLELGQPMHAFDLNKITGGINVRLAQPNESLVLLDGQEVQLKENSLVIADDQKVLALAGIMGGLDSAVTDDTHSILLESAFFEPTNIIGKARQYGLHTDSSHRFERGVDPELQRQAMERASELLLSIVGGEPGPIVEASSSDTLPQRKEILLRRARIARVLGLEIADQLVFDILQKLGMQVQQHAEGWTVLPPSYRFDINIEVDLIEEIVRIYGYDKVPSKQAIAHLIAGEALESKIPWQRFRSILVDRGYSEAITYSFVEPKMQKLLDPEHVALPLANPISAELSVMRTNLWPGLVTALLHNQNRQQTRVRLFEIGKRFVQQDGQLLQEPVLAGIGMGLPYPEQWGLKLKNLDFYDAKSDIEALLALIGNQPYEFKPFTHPACHPGQTAQIWVGDSPIGVFGILHPGLQRQLDVNSPAFLFEFDLKKLENFSIPRYTRISRFPAIRRDISFVLDENIHVSDICAQIRKNGTEILEKIEIFDQYQGEGIDLGKKSLAIGLTLQHSSRTLIDEEVNEFMQVILSDLKTIFNVTLRI